ncbi:MAG: ComEC/Rec2-related protein [Bacteroidetes bacterium]|nr:ComEC/Rec2-related protein [Bacteroidota bacterium]
MELWNQAPLVRLIIPFIAGIITAIYFPNQFAFLSAIVAALVFIIASIVLIPKLSIAYRNMWWFGLVLNITLFAMAYQLTIFKTEKYNTDHFSKLATGNVTVHARLAQSYIEKEKSLKMVLEVLEIKTPSGWIATSGKTMAYIKKNEQALQLKYGDELVFNSVFNEIPGIQNPGEFDYKRFLAFHNVFQQTSINNNPWLNLRINSGNKILSCSYAMRDRLLSVLTAEHVKGDEFAVGAALLLGYSDKLDAEIISAYSSTGALHVLSVSGLHVAIVYIVFNWLLFFLDKIKHGNIIKAIILILMLWFYSALTGLSPSVLRAAAMFSFIIIAKAFNRYTNIYNTLAASAFLLLAINPYLVMDVGFQLSYIAVIGIVYIQPKLNVLYEPGNWLMEQVWTITSVSIAAQIATFPLGLHYFHQFPNYFLISNFIVIPVSTVIMYAGIALFLFSKISFLAAYIALGFSWSVWLLNASVKWIEKWPYALIEGISITVTETILIYGIIVFLFYYFTKKQFKYLVYVFCAAVLLIISQLTEQQEQFRQKKIIVYNIPKTSAIDFVDAKSNVLLTDSAFAQNESGLLFHVKHNWWDLGLSNSKIITGNIKINALEIAGNAIQFNNKRMAIINAALEESGEQAIIPIEVDYLLISGNPTLKMEEALKRYRPKKIIFDSSNSLYHVTKWKTECMALSQKYYSVMDSGAFVEEIY